MRRLHPILRLLAIVGLLLFVPFSLTAGETWTLDDRTYENVRVQTVTDGTVTIFHQGGITQLELAALPPDLQARFDFNPEKAEIWKQQAESERSATEELKRRTLLMRKKLAAATQGEHYIETVWGRGYVLRDPQEEKTADVA